MGFILNPYRFSGGGLSGHPGVADWVSNNSGDVLAYFPMDDATTSGTMTDDSGNGRNGTYHSAGVSSGTIDGWDACDFDGSTGFAYVTDAAWLDSIVGIFAVIEYDADENNMAIMARDGLTQRQWQWRLPQGASSSASGLQLLQIEGSNPSMTTVAASITHANRHTIGVYTSGATKKLYVDGSSVSLSGGSPTLETGSQRLSIGCMEYTTQDFHYNGRIASVVFLSAADDASFSELHAAWVGS